MHIEKLGVVGCGSMGSGIVEAAAACGFDVLAVKVTDGDPHALLGRVTRAFAEHVAHRTMTPEARDAALSRIHATDDFDLLSTRECVIESAIERLDEKRALLEDIETRLEPSAILASTTGALPLHELGARLLRPCRFLGVHFLYPAPRTPLAEVAPGPKTRPEVLDDVNEMLRRMGKTVVTTSDQPGYVVNRLLVPHMLQAMALLESGAASVDDIDRAMTLGCNHPIGPLALADEIGLDVVLAMARSLAGEYGDSRFTPPSVLLRLVATGHLGCKRHVGFYDYSSDPPAPNPWLELHAASHAFSLRRDPDERPSVA